MEGRQNLVVYIGLSASGAREAHELSLLGNRVLDFTLSAEINREDSQKCEERRHRRP